MLEISQEINKTLRETGLDRTEIQVYILLLSKGLLSIQDITNELKLPRSSIQLACENLLNKDVLKVSVTGKRRNFFVEHPNDVEKFIKQKENKLQTEKLAIESIMPKLNSLYAISKESEPIDIEELEGEDGFVETFYKSLNQPKNSEVIRFGGDPAVFTVGRDKLKKYREKRMKKKIFARLLLPQSELSEKEIEDAKFKMREVRLLDKEIFDPKVQMSIWQDCTAVTVWDKGLHSIILRNKAISNLLKQLFEIAWKEAEEK